MSYITKLPFEGKFNITQIYGNKSSMYKSGVHQGIDMVGKNPSVYSINVGTVVYAGWENAGNPKQGFGKYVAVKFDVTPTGYKKVYYGHLSSINVKVGQTVSNATILGIMGSTGYSTGNHTHLEIREYNSAGTLLRIINPANYMGIPNAVGLYDSVNYRTPVSVQATSKYSAGSYKVTSSAGVNVRAGAGTNYTKITAIGCGSLQGIDKTDGDWGHLSNNVGWINLNYCQKI